MYKDLHTFRITGGEPLLSKDTWGVLDYIIEHPEPNRKINLAINSIGEVSDQLTIPVQLECKSGVFSINVVNAFIKFLNVL